MYNFNTHNATEYDLYADLIDETINLYGVNCKILFTEKLNSDDTVFGDYSSIKTDGTKIFSIFLLPENTEDWDTGGYNFSEFGLMNLDNTNLYISKVTVKDVLNIEFKELFNNLIVMPSNKILEITDVEPAVPGVNNLFTHNNAKSVYKLTCKPYSVKLTDEIDPTDISYSETEDYSTLNNYFDELVQVKTEQDSVEIQPSENVVQKTGSIDLLVQKPIVDNSEDDVFGGF